MYGLIIPCIEQQSFALFGENATHVNERLDAIADEAWKKI